MNKIKKFNEYSNIASMVDCFMHSLYQITEKNSISDDIYNKHKDSIISKFNIELKDLGMFSDKVSMFMPIINELLSNCDRIELEGEVSVIASICTFYVICLEYETYPNKDENILTTTSKTLLEELKLRGVGNGVIKKIIKSLYSIKDLFSFMYKDTNTNIDEFSDLLKIKGLSNLLKAILSVISSNKFDYNNCPKELLSIIGGIESSVSREDMDKLLKSIDSDDVNKEQIIKNTKPKKINKFDIDSSNGIGTEYNDSEMIKEQ